ncbi:MAG: alpha/beta hydrolase [Bacteroidales bacterium]|nr:alpha/beta hydrolase [Bacteroidales bacterium]
MVLVLFLSVFVHLYAASPVEYKLYPNGVPDDNGLAGKNEPVMFVYTAPENVATGQAVVICPGGGYLGLSIESEGHMVARWLNEHGITGVVLRYRMPNAHCQIPLEDALKAIKLVRENSKTWKVNPAKVGVMGFSAGGHLAATASTLCDSASRPAFSILIYPVITMTALSHGGSKSNLLGRNPSSETVEKYSAELHVSPQTPPAFIALCSDETCVKPVNSTMYYNALINHKISAEMHIYPHGNHGWGFASKTFQYYPEFKTALARWLAEQNGH